MPNYQRTKRACYFAYVAMSSVFSLPPLLFVTFREMYGISFTLLGTLVAVNFCTQLAVDLVFTFFAKHFNIHATVKVMPLLTSAGLIIYALVPTFFPHAAYAGFLVGTVLFSVAAGLSEVLLSPTIAAIPSEHPEKDMSFLHSLYAWGVVSVVLVSSLYFLLFGRENWMYLTLFFSTLPLISSWLFATSPMPAMELSHGERGKKGNATGLALCGACIFLGAAAENTMTNWVSGYMETALHIPKAWGDVFGVALFALLLGLGRILYAKRGKNIQNTILFSMIGATACYVIAGVSQNALLAFFACIFTGLCTSMLWPGTLILMEEKLPQVGVAAYALMAAAGDFGSSVAPQLMGVITDTVAASDWAAAFTHLSPDQIGMKVGMLIAAVFPLLGVVLMLYTKRFFRRAKLK